jgi:hypothetical protein
MKITLRATLMIRISHTNKRNLKLIHNGVYTLHCIYLAREIRREYSRDPSAKQLLYIPDYMRCHIVWVTDTHMSMRGQ